MFLKRSNVARNETPQFTGEIKTFQREKERNPRQRSKLAFLLFNVATRKLWREVSNRAKEISRLNEKRMLKNVFDRYSIE